MSERRDIVLGAKSVFCYEHMAHHLLPNMRRGWLSGLIHAFLIGETKSILALLSRLFPMICLLSERFVKLARREGERVVA